VFYNTTLSKPGATAMVSIMIALSIFCGMTNMATDSGQLFAFARDHGVPFSGFFSAVAIGWDIPLNAVLFTITISCLLSIINIGSLIAFNQITSSSLCALLSPYTVSISCMALKRIHKEPLLQSHLVLGRWGLPINLLSLGFLLLAFIMIFFPPQAHPAAHVMN
jgi:amino acid transporter